MANTSVEIVGGAALTASLRKAADNLNDMSEPARQTAQFLAGRGRVSAPRRTGRLASSVRAASDRLEARVTSGLPYSNRTHWGYARYGQAAQPWLLYGAYDSEGQWIGNYEHRVDDVIGKVKGA